MVATNDFEVPQQSFWINKIFDVINDLWPRSVYQTFISTKPNEI